MMDTSEADADTTAHGTQQGWGGESAQHHEDPRENQGEGDLMIERRGGASDDSRHHSAIGTHIIGCTKPAGATTQVRKFPAGPWRSRRSRNERSRRGAGASLPAARLGRRARRDDRDDRRQKELANELGHLRGVAEEGSSQSPHRLAYVLSCGGSRASRCAKTGQQQASVAAKRPSQQTFPPTRSHLEVPNLNVVPANRGMQI